MKTAHLRLLLGCSATQGCPCTDKLAQVGLTEAISDSGLRGIGDGRCCGPVFGVPEKAACNMLAAVMNPSPLSVTSLSCQCEIWDPVAGWMSSASPSSPRAMNPQIQALRHGLREHQILEPGPKDARLPENRLIPNMYALSLPWEKIIHQAPGV